MATQVRIYVRDPVSRVQRQFTCLDLLSAPIPTQPSASAIDKSAVVDIAVGETQYSVSWGGLPNCKAVIPKPAKRASRDSTLALARIYGLLVRFYEQVNHPTPAGGVVKAPIMPTDREDLRDPGPQADYKGVLQALKNDLTARAAVQAASNIEAVHNVAEVKQTVVYARCFNAAGKAHTRELYADNADPEVQAALQVLWAEVDHWRAKLIMSTPTVGTHGRFYDHHLQGFSGRITTPGANLLDYQLVAGVYLLQTYSVGKPKGLLDLLKARTTQG